MKNYFSVSRISFVSVSLMCFILFSSCADSKKFNINGEMVTVEPYGWLNSGDKNENIIYESNTGNLVWSILLSETIVVPIWLTGYNYYEPISKK